MAGEVDQRAWRALSAQVQRELAAWRAAHPRATPTEIATAVAEATRRLQAQSLRDLVAAKPARRSGRHPAGRAPPCPRGGGVLVARGQHERAVLPPGQPEPVRFQRSYAVCTGCGAGRPPPDEEPGLLPGALSPTLAAGVGRLGAALPFARAAREVAFFWQVSPGASTVWRQTETVGAAHVALQDAAVAALERAAPAPPAGLPVQQAGAAGALVPLVGGARAEGKAVVIGTPRAPVAEDGAWRAHATCTRRALVETHRRGVATAGTVVGVTDGSAWLRGFLDFPPAVEHLTAAARATCGAGSPAARRRRAPPRPAI